MYQMLLKHALTDPSWAPCQLFKLFCWPENVFGQGNSISQCSFMLKFLFLLNIVSNTKRSAFQLPPVMAKELYSLHPLPLSLRKEMTPATICSCYQLTQIQPIKVAILLFLSTAAWDEDAIMEKPVEFLHIVQK